jgi:hypothetical protein
MDQRHDSWQPQLTAAERAGLTGSVKLCAPCRKRHLDTIADSRAMSTWSTTPTSPHLDGTLKVRDDEVHIEQNHSGPMAGLDGFRYTDAGTAQRSSAKPVSS